jgi:putative endonuclease
MKKTEKRLTGDYFEEITAEWMKKNGYRIVARNWEKHPHELDIVALHGNTLVFTEVKSANVSNYEPPEKNIDKDKMLSLTKAAIEFLRELEDRGIDTARLNKRFDAAAITFSSEREIVEFRYYENYFICSDDRFAGPDTEDNETEKSLRGKVNE